MRGVAAPNNGDAGRDNPIVLGLAGPVGRPGLNPACFEAEFKKLPGSGHCCLLQNNESAWQGRQWEGEEWGRGPPPPALPPAFPMVGSARPHPPSP